MLVGVFGLTRAYLFKQWPCNMLAPTVLPAPTLQPKIIIEPEIAEVKAVSREIRDNCAVLFDSGRGTEVTWLDAGTRKTSLRSVVSMLSHRLRLIPQTVPSTPVFGVRETRSWRSLCLETTVRTR
jgi:hypothetical protein